MSFHKCYLGIDLGSTSVKALLLSEDGVPLGQESCEYKTYYPKPLWVEQAPEEWWSATKKAVRTLVDKHLRKDDSVCGISVSSQAPALVGIDRNGKPIGNAWIWMDRRATSTCQKVLSPYAEEILHDSGNINDPYYTLGKLVWMQRNRPDLLERMETLLQVNGYIVYRMTGKVSVDAVHAPLSQLYDIHRGDWNKKLLQKLNLPDKILPDILPCRQIAGILSSSVAAEMGLQSGAPVAAGCTDGAASAYGLGLNESGLLFEMSGQSSGIGLIVDRPMQCPPLCLIKHPLQDMWIIKGSTSSSGGAMKWFRDMVEGTDGILAYQSFDQLSAQSPPGARGLFFLPYLSGERAPLWDSYARGVYFGIGSDTGKADMVRAIMEGTAYCLKSIYSFLPQDLISGRRIYGTGGGYKSKAWSQIKADVLNAEIAVCASNYDAATVGSASIAMEAVTGTICPRDIRRQAVEHVYTPDRERAERYQERYAIFQGLYYANKPLFDKNFQIMQQDQM